MEIINNFSDIFLSVWKKGILGVDIFQILIGIGIFFIFLIFRGLPAVKIIKRFQSKNYDTAIVDPNFYEYRINNSKKIDSLLAQANVIVTLVGHKEFLSKAFIKKLHKYHYKIIDFCNLLNLSKF